jgi:hypothetical protein
MEGVKDMAKPMVLKLKFETPGLKGAGQRIDGLTKRIKEAVRQYEKLLKLKERVDKE